MAWTAFQESLCSRRHRTCEIRLVVISEGKVFTENCLFYCLNGFVCLLSQPSPSLMAPLHVGYLDAKSLILMSSGSSNENYFIVFKSTDESSSSNIIYELLEFVQRI